MKTAISLPDDIFERASRRASDLGVSRSEFFARAADNYLHELDASSTTNQIDSALDAINGEDESNRAAVAAGHQLLTEGAEDW
ncbi:MAG: hypothetical protein WAS07_15525 [Micropruina sp.]